MTEKRIGFEEEAIVQKIKHAKRDDEQTRFGGRSIGDDVLREDFRGYGLSNGLVKSVGNVPSHKPSHRQNTCRDLMIVPDQFGTHTEQSRQEKIKNPTVKQIGRDEVAVVL